MAVELNRLKREMSIPKEPEQVMKMRGGSVLGKRTILKSDHFPGCQNKRLTPQIDGAPNYRQVCSFFFLLFLVNSCCWSISNSNFGETFCISFIVLHSGAFFILYDDSIECMMYVAGNYFTPN